MPRLLYSGFAWSHHDSVSGYHHVVPEGATYVNGSALPGAGREMRSNAWRRLNFILVDFLTAIQLLWCDVVVIFYPEQTAYFSPLIAKLFGKRVVYVLHLGREYWTDTRSLLFFLKRICFDRADRFIVLSSEQEVLYSRLVKVPVRKIHHGAWCEAYRPLDGVPAPVITVVGENYRDFDLLERIVRLFGERAQEFQFQLIGMGRTGRERFAGFENVTVCPRLETEAYREAIARSLCVVLPLTFATANNALLESLCSGVPVFCNETEGVLDYLPGRKYAFSSPEGFLEDARKLACLGEDDWASLRAELRRFAEACYAWPAIRRQVVDFASEGLN